MKIRRLFLVATFLQTVPLFLFSFPALQFFLRGSALLLRVWWAFDERWKSESMTQFRQRRCVDGAEHPRARCLSISRRSPSLSLSAFCWLIIESFVFVCSRPGKTIKRRAEAALMKGTDGEREGKKQAGLVLGYRERWSRLISSIEAM